MLQLGAGMCVWDIVNPSGLEKPEPAHLPFHANQIKWAQQPSKQGTREEVALELVANWMINRTNHSISQTTGRPEALIGLPPLIDI
jgi:hypothetical protein